ncbi:hypothetical protein F383_36387 [Gossypium arboreum]|uniref:Uncharacterized protein n=1 Tax=Gossypium arboreum TaxID=29729 RepID=A0A0B0N4A2_GOSAR|nr:hypothetical protein F383_36387 [Gossypium arboreum]
MHTASPLSLHSCV